MGQGSCLGEKRFYIEELYYLITGFFSYHFKRKVINLAPAILYAFVIFMS